MTPLTSLLEEKYACYAAMESASKIEVELTNTVGLDFIEAMEGNNTLGKDLAQSLEPVLNIMRLSQVLANAHMSLQDFNSKYGHASYKNFAMKTQRQGTLFESLHLEMLACVLQGTRAKLHTPVFQCFDGQGYLHCL